MRSRSATDSGATRNTARVAPRLSSWSSQTMSVRSGIAGANDVRIRDAVSDISLSAATASARAAAALASLVAVDRRPGRARRVAQRSQVGRHLVVEVIEAARCAVVDRRGEGGRRGLQPLVQLRAHQAGDPSRGDTEGGRRQLRGGHRRHPVDQLVRFVDHQQRVLGQHRRFGHRIDGQQRVIGDDDIGAAGRPRARSEKHSVPNGQRATPRHSRADTLTCDQDRSATPGFRSSRSPDSVVGRPGGEPLHVAAQCGHRHRVEQFFLRSVAGAFVVGA